MIAVGRFLSALLLGLAAGIPFLLGLAAESTVIAWVVDGLRWFGDPGFATVFWWTFGVQAALICLFAVPAIIAQSVRTARHGWDVAR